MNDQMKDQIKKEYYLLFRLDLQSFAVAFSQVIRVIPLQKATLVPAVPDYIEGVVHSNGQFVPQVRMKQLLGLQDMGLGEPIHAVVVQDSEGKMSFSFAMDSKGNIVQVKDIEKKVQGAKSEMEFYSGQFVLEDEIVFVIDIDQLMATYKVEKEAS